MTIVNCFIKVRKISNYYGRIFLRNLHNHHVCVIGSGPAGFYAAQHILKLRSSSQTQLKVDIYEKLPVPFGLVRYGVAPDHPEVKNVINSFSEVLKNQNVRFVGNVEAGANFSLSDLVKAYHAVVLCYGATSDNLLNIPNENLVTSAREFVGWYNGLPYNSNLPVNLGNSTRAVIIGHGNVALDIGRILLTDTKSLETTDIAPYALEELRRSRINEVYIVGRRGVLQVSFTIKEFREMVKIPGISWDIDLMGQERSISTDDLQRPRKRLTELILKSAESTRKDNNSSIAKQWVLKFLRSPIRIDKTDDGRLKIQFAINKLDNNNKPIKTDRIEEIVCDHIFRSIGYKGKPVFEELPFNHETGVIVNNGGRVTKGIYCSGWAGQGPRGVILSTMQNAFEVAKLVHSDLESSAIGNEPKEGYSTIFPFLSSIRVTGYSDYLKIAEWEQANGKKITNVHDMITVCNTS